MFHFVRFFKKRFKELNIDYFAYSYFKKSARMAYLLKEKKIISPLKTYKSSKFLALNSYFRKYFLYKAFRLYLLKYNRLSKNLISPLYFDFFGYKVYRRSLLFFFNGIKSYIVSKLLDSEDHDISQNFDLLFINRLFKNKSINRGLGSLSFSSNEDLMTIKVSSLLNQSLFFGKFSASSFYVYPKLILLPFLRDSKSNLLIGNIRQRFFYRVRERFSKLMFLSYLEHKKIKARSTNLILSDLVNKIEFKLYNSPLHFILQDFSLYNNTMFLYGKSLHGFSISFKKALSSILNSKKFVTSFKYYKNSSICSYKRRKRMSFFLLKFNSYFMNSLLFYLGFSIINFLFYSIFLKSSSLFKFDLANRDFVSLYQMSFFKSNSNSYKNLSLKINTFYKDLIYSKFLKKRNFENNFLFFQNLSSSFKYLFSNNIIFSKRYLSLINSGLKKKPNVVSNYSIFFFKHFQNRLIFFKSKNRVKNPILKNRSNLKNLIRRYPKLQFFFTKKKLKVSLGFKSFSVLDFFLGKKSYLFNFSKYIRLLHSFRKFKSLKRPPFVLFKTRFNSVFKSRFSFLKSKKSVPLIWKKKNKVRVSFTKLYTGFFVLYNLLKNNPKLVSHSKYNKFLFSKINRVNVRAVSRLGLQFTNKVYPFFISGCSSLNLGLGFNYKLPYFVKGNASNFYKSFIRSIYPFYSPFFKRISLNKIITKKRLRKIFGVKSLREIRHLRRPFKFRGIKRHLLFRYTVENQFFFKKLFNFFFIPGDNSFKRSRAKRFLFKKANRLSGYSKFILRKRFVKKSIFNFSNSNVKFYPFTFFSKNYKNFKHMFSKTKKIVYNNRSDFFLVNKSLKKRFSSLTKPFITKIKIKKKRKSNFVLRTSKQNAIFLTIALLKKKKKTALDILLATFSSYSLKKNKKNYKYNLLKKEANFLNFKKRKFKFYRKLFKFKKLSVKSNIFFFRIFRRLKFRSKFRNVLGLVLGNSLKTFDFYDIVRNKKYKGIYNALLPYSSQDFLNSSFIQNFKFYNLFYKTFFSLLKINKKFKKLTDNYYLVKFLRKGYLPRLYIKVVSENAGFLKKFYGNSKILRKIKASKKFSKKYQLKSTNYFKNKRKYKKYGIKRHSFSYFFWFGKFLKPFVISIKKKLNGLFYLFNFNFFSDTINQHNLKNKFFIDINSFFFKKSLFKLHSLRLNHLYARPWIKKFNFRKRFRFLLYFGHTNKLAPQFKERYINFKKFERKKKLRCLKLGRRYRPKSPNYLPLWIYRDAAKKAFIDFKKIRSRFFLFVSASFSNVFFTLTDIFGNVLLTLSGGNIKTVKKKREALSYDITVELLTKLVSFIQANKIYHVHLCNRRRIKHYSLRLILRTFRKNRIRIKSIIDNPLFAHNGCRFRKARRL
jgi:ribosomal protein S11